MIRLIIDKLGDGNNDLFLKVDSMPSYLKTADSYYLKDFLEIEDTVFENLKSEDVIRYDANLLVDYWHDRIKTIEKKQPTFIPFDLWDEYIGGLLFEKIKLGIKVKMVSTDKIHGYEVTKSNLDRLIEERRIEFNEEEMSEWLMGIDVIFNGLKWSKDEILK
jgi:hypothetical protein